jgi:hypothetical protein
LEGGHRGPWLVGSAQRLIDINAKNELRNTYGS